MMDIIEDVRRGRTIPAAFQRPYVWTAADIEALWKSILMGYPIGALLLWQPRDRTVPGKRMLGPIQADSDDRCTIILDGQNRLVTIAWSLTPGDVRVDPAAPGYDIWRSGKTLTADPYTRTVRFVDDAEIKGMMMPVHNLTGTFNTFLRRNWVSEEDDVHAEWLDHLGSRQREARIIKATIERATPEEAREAFLHISRAGVPMSAADFDAAMGFDLDEPRT